MINVALIGCGNWGKNYLRNLSELPGARLVACCDKKESRLRQIRERYPFIRVTRDYNEIASNPKIDAVVIATPPGTHHQIARACLLRGKHVLVEKPFTLSPGDAEDLVTLSRKTGKVLMVGHIMNYHPAVRQIKEYLRAGELGQVYYIHSNRTSLGVVRNDVSVLWDKAPHDVAILLYLLEDEPTHVAAVGQAFTNPTLEDVIFLSLRFRDNVIANIHVSWINPRKESTTAIVGRKKMLVFNDVEAVEKLRIYNNGVGCRDAREGNNIFTLSGLFPVSAIRGLKGQPVPREAVAAVPAGPLAPGGSAPAGSDPVAGCGTASPNGDGSHLNGDYENGNGSSDAALCNYGDVYIPKIKMVEPLRNQCLHFLECIREGKKPLTDGESGLAVVRVLDRAEESLRSNGEYVPVYEGDYVFSAGRRGNFMAKARSLWRGLKLEKIF
ncbi:MAG TPA: Gfo/Idh/MocA family oxidoreductase [Firmicutes bacterium]|nr:Gfo/Idh/MocA family oxidoreductase [Bacillota bacterium]